MMTGEELTRLVREANERFNALPWEERRRLREVQRRSFVIGNLMLDHPEWTREYAERLYDQRIDY